MSLDHAHIPVIETERLMLTRPDATEWPRFRALFRWERSRRCGGPLGSGTRIWQVFAAHLGHWSLRGFGLFGVRRRTGGRPVGMVGHDGPEGWPEREIGWLLWYGKEGRGDARAAARAVRDHLYHLLGRAGAASYVDPEYARHPAPEARP